MIRVALLGLLLAAPLTAKTVVTNANGYTLTKSGNLDRFTGLVIGDDGRIERVMHAGDAVPAGPRFDAHGKTLLPGLIDAHGHVMALGERALAVDLTDTPTLAAALAKLKAYAVANLGSKWLTGGGWNQEIWNLGRFPTAAELDAAVGDRPVALWRVDGHAVWANSKAIAAAGIDAKTADPPGGRIERDTAGAPAGVLVDAAFAPLVAAVPPRTEAEEDAALDAAMKAMASVGLTGVHDAGTLAKNCSRFDRFAREGRLTARIYVMAKGLENLDGCAPLGPVDWRYDDVLAIRSMKLQADGALGSRGGALAADYSDAPGERGLSFYPGDALRAAIAAAAAKGFQVNVHAIGDAANHQFFDAVVTLPPATRAALRLRNEHAQVVDPADLPKFKALGVIASIQPTHATSDKDMALARLGPSRLAGAYAYRSILDSGAAVAGGSDFPVESPNPFYGLHAAVTREDRTGTPRGGWRSQEKLTLSQAFAAFTTGAAYAGFAETKVGTLEPGKWADFVLIDRDIFTVPPGDIWRAQVEATFLAGNPVYERGVPARRTKAAIPAPARPPSSIP